MGYYAFYVEEGRSLTDKSKAKACPIRSYSEGKHFCKMTEFPCVGGVAHRPDFCPLIKIPRVKDNTIDTFVILMDYYKLQNKLRVILGEDE